MDNAVSPEIFTLLFKSYGNRIRYHLLYYLLCISKMLISFSSAPGRSSCVKDLLALVHASIEHNYIQNLNSRMYNKVH